MTLDDFLRLLPGPRKSGSEYTDLCPVHEPPGLKHKTPSLNVRLRGDYIVVNCRSRECSTAEICRALGVDPRELWTGLPGRIVKTYPYEDEQGRLQYQVTRHEPGANGRKKEFRQWVPDPTRASGWRAGLDGARRVLYHLPALLNSRDMVFLPEGEKDCEYLESIGLVATTNSGGAKGWRDEYSDSLSGRIVNICGDNDENGRIFTEVKAYRESRPQSRSSIRQRNSKTWRTGGQHKKKCTRQSTQPLNGRKPGPRQKRKSPGANCSIPASSSMLRRR
jgi:hypothetical protein